MKSLPITNQSNRIFCSASSANTCLKFTLQLPILSEGYVLKSPLPLLRLSQHEWYSCPRGKHGLVLHMEGGR